MFFGSGAGLAPPSVPGLVGLVEMPLVPAQDRDGLGGDVSEPDLAPLPDPDRFTEEQWQAVDTLFELDGICRDHPTGADILVENPARVDMHLLSRFAEYQDFRSRTRSD
jgi:hypothetical protein